MNTDNKKNRDRDDQHDDVFPTHIKHIVHGRNNRIVPWVENPIFL